MVLKDLKIGESAIIRKVGGEGALRQHFLDMGLIPGVEVTMVKLAPLGDPMEVRLHGYELTLRKEEASQIEIEKVKSADAQGGTDAEADPAGKDGAAQERARTDVRESEHPGLGEGGRFHAKGEGDPLPDGTTLTYALVGNQNSGKTTLFNQLTGSNQHVGNFPGVTVDRKDGVIKGHPDTLVT
ncbi:MAG: FeoA domain-containing protein, partial [Firmicutes bacterium]|nr:FeoA domain-containing protein [Bacillota bacterium]